MKIDKIVMCDCFYKFFGGGGGVTRLNKKSPKPNYSVYKRKEIYLKFSSFLKILWD